MGGDISTALSLLAIGMITVFIVLLLVVLTGNLLIRVVNSMSNSSPDGKIDAAGVAAITTAVEIFTEGRGQITRIEKL
ncbi:MAG: hypothetical protein RIM99_13220 [Cyclobacteriaceae bacterium]